MRLLRNKRNLIILLICFHFFECKNSSNEHADDEFYNKTDGYKDGSYCAEVDYYYSETGTKSTYTLLVDIENNELVKIYWPNSGWLDNSHFSSPNIQSGQADFTSDRGVEYSIKILGKDEDCEISNNVKDENTLIQEKEDNENQEEIKKNDDNEQ